VGIGSGKEERGEMEKRKEERGKRKEGLKRDAKQDPAFPSSVGSAVNRPARSDWEPVKPARGTADASDWLGSSYEETTSESNPLT
jgi:hypothetical protein